ncbi:MAG: type II/IV secretion system protein [Alphaproteobacteria bacterium]|jgi:type II secretory ATPase GspE/PulE/Tfp pilus assembly ATPase PilB-like protein|nr:type II/IV secretion system protein [Alphaproteobacteria bacterium]MBP7729731.1 type II/IV secretion system protein [Alphaproteobacteria bacterium]
MKHKKTQDSNSVSQTFITTLIEKGFLSFDQVDVVLKEQRVQKSSFEDCLVSLGFISEAALAEVLSLTSGYDKINLKQTLLDPALKDLISREIAERFCLIPLSIEEGTFRVAVADIYNLPALDYLRYHTPFVQKVIPVIAPESDILEAIDGFYGYNLLIPALLRELEEASPHIFSKNNPINPTVRLINALLIDAIKLNASDIHFEPEGSFMRLRYRLDGILSQICTLHSSYWPAICVRLKVMAEMNIAESRRPQNGRMTFYVGPREIDLRVASHPTVHGENIVVRILDKNRSLLSLDELGYSKDVIRQIKEALKRPEGIFIITGPTGCGKTTSLYSMLNYISSLKLNIMTLEEPVEYQLPLIRQSHVREQGGMTFAEGIRSILRQDPDIILIGEIRDPPTAQMALRAAMTGHQIFSTLHTNDALGSIPRLIDLGLSQSMLAGNLMAVIAQRLVRKLCLSCKQVRRMNSYEAVLLGLEIPSRLRVPKGCELCQKTGYRGRVAIAEILVFDPDLDELLITSTSRLPLKHLAQKKGYIPMGQDARQRVLKGDTSLEEVLRSIDLREGI